eukprot:m.29814 g.29814  ORF g.29814 m.29814 type:complete len:60 (-) comp12158_c0_seq1:134-313(-)
MPPKLWLFWAVVNDYRREEESKKEWEASLKDSTAGTARLSSGVDWHSVIDAEAASAVCT